MHLQRATSLLNHSPTYSETQKLSVSQIRQQFEHPTKTPPPPPLRHKPPSGPKTHTSPPTPPIRSSTNGILTNTFSPIVRSPATTSSCSPASVSSTGSSFLRSPPGGLRSSFGSTRSDYGERRVTFAENCEGQTGRGLARSRTPINVGTGGWTTVYPEGWNLAVRGRSLTPDPTIFSNYDRKYPARPSSVCLKDVVSPGLAGIPNGACKQEPERTFDGGLPPPHYNQFSQGTPVQAPTGGLKPSDWSDVDGGINGRRARPVKREEPRRHTVAGENIKSKNPDNSINMDLELTKSSSESGDPKKDLILGHLQRRFPEYASTIAGHKEQGHLYPQRGHPIYQPPPSIYDDDPGIMSEVETSATGFRRGGKQRSSLPVVRTPNKTLERPLVPSRGPAGYTTSGPPYKQSERPLGLVFLQYRSETKRALLPNEITSLDTVKALFVRSFPKQLTMEYLDSPHIRIYIHDPSKDMFYELEDLRDIRDRSVLRIYEQDVNGGGTPSNWDQDLSYFSEPEFDSDYQHQHIHRAKKTYAAPATSNYYGTMTHSYPPSLSVAHTATLPRTSQPMRPYSPAASTLEKPKPQALPPTGPVQPPPKPQRTYQQPMTSVAKSVRATPPPQGPPPPAPSPRTNTAVVGQGYPMSPERPVPYRATPERSYTQPSFASAELRHDEHSSPDRRHHPAHESGYHSSPERRVEHHRLFPAYLTPSSSYEEPYYGADRHGSRSGSVTPIIDEEARLRMQMMERQLANLTGLVHKALTTGRQASVTRDVEVNLNREHLQIPPSSTPVPNATRDTSSSTTTPYRSTAEKPTKSAIKPSSRQTSLTEVQLTPEMYNQLRLLKKKTKDLRLEVRNLRRMSQAQALNIKETIRETFLKIKAMLAAVQVNDQVQSERVRVSREEELYTQDVQRLEKDLTELEGAVEELRSNVINRRCRVNMSDVESMALILSKSSKTVADLKTRFPNLQESLKAVMAAEMEMVVQEEKFLKEEPDRLETALRRCKKLTGTLVTLKRLASVQEQRLPPSGSGPLSPSLPGEHRDHTLPHGGSLDAQLSKAASFSGELRSSYDGQKPQKAENALDALLDELQTFAKPGDRKSDVVLVTAGGSLKRVSSYSGVDSPSKGQILSQGPAGVVSTSVVTSAISKLQVTDAGSKRNVNLSPTPSPIPTEGKISPVSQELLNKMATGVVKQPDGTEGPVKTTVVGGIVKKVPPPPPPRTSSKSPLMSPTSPMSPTNRLLALGTLPRGTSLHSSVISRVSSTEPSHYRSNVELVLDDSIFLKSHLKDTAKKDPSQVIRTSAISDENLRREQLSSNSSSSESVNSQEGVQMRMGHHGGSRGNSSSIHHISSGAMSDSETIKKPAPPVPPSRNRQELLEQRHQELLRKQRQLQEQYARLQQLQRGQTLQRFSPPRSPADLKKTGSESNILLKAGLTMTTASGSLTHLAPLAKSITTSNSFIASTTAPTPITTATATTAASSGSSTQTTNKIYETDIL